MEKIYLNPKQLAFLYSIAKKKVFIGGRGSGKTFIIGWHIVKFSRNMPRSKGYLLGRSYPEIEGNILPPILEVFEMAGLVSGVHYVIGTKPPSKWQRPIKPHQTFDHVISFSNGSALVMLSLHKKDGLRGGNFDYGIIDEAVLIPEHRYKKEVLPLIRGNDMRFSKEKCHQTRLFTSSQAWLPEGEWVSNMENEPDTFYIESTAYDNEAVIGAHTIEMWRKEMDYLTFEVEIMNKRVTRVSNGFYNALNERRHIYPSDAYESDYDSKLPLAISFDFGASICCCTVHQERMSLHGDFFRTEDRMVDCFVQKIPTDAPLTESLLDMLLLQIVKKYGKHQNLIEIWGDRNGNNKQANSPRTMYQHIIDSLKKKGLTTVLKVKGLDLLHKTKYQILNDLLGESKDLPVIRINRDTCKFAIISLQLAPVKDDFQKDKSSERQGGDQAKATHLSDCFDNYYAKKYHHKYGGTAYTPIMPM
jgi:Terminase large subunit, T4likevirus-type, N-terminal